MFVSSKEEHLHKQYSKHIILHNIRDESEKTTHTLNPKSKQTHNSPPNPVELTAVASPQVWIALPIVFGLASLFLIVMPILERPIEVGASIGVICTGLPVYYVTVYRQDIAKKFDGVLGDLSFSSFRGHLNLNMDDYEMCLMFLSSWDSICPFGFCI